MWLRRANGEDRGTEELWTDLFNTLKEAYDSHSQNNDRVRNTLLNFVALNCHLATSHESFKRNSNDLIVARPEFGTDLIFKVMAGAELYMSAVENAIICTKCKEGAMWTWKHGRDPPKFCPGRTCSFPTANGQMCYLFPQKSLQMRNC